MIAIKNFFHESLKNEIIDVLHEVKDKNDYLKIATDTRLSLSGQAFLAIKGEKYDAFKLLKPYLKEIPLVIYENSEDNSLLAKAWSKEFEKTCFIAVKNSVTYLQKLASVHVKEWNATTSIHHLIAISGSNGKTTTKEMLYHLLKNILPNQVIATQKNNNNHIGVPLTLFDIDPRQTKVAVVEFGSNHPGEIAVLCRLSFPNVGITTNIGYTHMEFFNDLEDVFNEEGLIYHSVMKETCGKGVFLINDDDMFLKTFSDTENSIRFSCLNKQAQAFYQIYSQGVSITLKNHQEFTITNRNILGRHNFINLANAFIIAWKLFPHYAKQLQEAAQSFHPTPNRSEWIRFQDKEIFLDAYNANPSSMRAALMGFLEMAERDHLPKESLLVVVGEMKELGLKAAQYHAEFAKWLNTLSLPNVIYIGGFREEIVSNASQVSCFPNVESAQATFLDKLSNVQKSFLKASRSLQLERLVGITKG